MDGWSKKRGKEEDSQLAGETRPQKKKTYKQTL